MLALTDSALARLAIAATRVDPRERGQWLQIIAAKLETLCTEEISSADRKKMTAAPRPAARRSNASGKTAISTSAGSGSRAARCSV